MTGNGVLCQAGREEGKALVSGGPGDCRNKGMTLAKQVARKRRQEAPDLVQLLSLGFGQERLRGQFPETCFHEVQDALNADTRESEARCRLTR